MNSNLELTPYNKRVMNTIILMLENWLENNPDKNKFEIYIKSLNLNVEISTYKNDNQLRFVNDIITFKK